MRIARVYNNLNRPIRRCDSTTGQRMLDPFASSDAFTIGVELEVQIVNTHD
jgi:hypothetical protein